MSVREYVFMATDECGDDFRAYGTPFLERKYTFPDTKNDESLECAFYSWLDSMEERANREWESVFGDECRIYLEETHDSVFRHSYHHYI